jgi:hypothetical protein
MSIIHIPDDIKKEFKLTSDGVAVVSIRGAARIVGVSETALRNNLKFKGANFSSFKMAETSTVKPLKGANFSKANSADFSFSKMAEMLIDAGFKGADFSNFLQLGIPDKAIAIIIEYYTFEAEENCTELAKAAYRSFAVIGIRTWVQSELGYSKLQQTKHLTSKDLTETQLDALNLALIIGSKGEDRELILQDVPRIFWDLTMPMVQQLEAILRYSFTKRVGGYWAKYYQEEFDSGRMGKTTFGIRQFELANSSQSMYMVSQCEKTRLAIEVYDAKIDRTQLTGTNNQKQLTKLN